MMQSGQRDSSSSGAYPECNNFGACYGKHSAVDQLFSSSE
jgi:hypothetical protein